MGKGMDWIEFSGIFGVSWLGRVSCWRLGETILWKNCTFITPLNYASRSRLVQMCLCISFALHIQASGSHSFSFLHIQSVVSHCFVPGSRPNRIKILSFFYSSLCGKKEKRSFDLWRRWHSKWCAHRSSSPFWYEFYCFKFERTSIWSIQLPFHSIRRAQSGCREREGKQMKFIPNLGPNWLWKAFKTVKFFVIFLSFTKLIFDGGVKNKRNDRPFLAVFSFFNKGDLFSCFFLWWKEVVG